MEQSFKTANKLASETGSVMQLFKHEHSLPLIILTVIFAGLYLPSVGALGFYHDEWDALKNFPAISLLKLLNNERPVNGFLYFLGVKLVDFNPLGLHLISRCILLTTAYLAYFGSLRFFALFRSGCEQAKAAALVTAVIWLVSPWQHGATFWSTAFPVLIGLTFLLASLFFALRVPNTASQRHLAWVSYLLAIFTYQAFWFACIPILLALLAARRQHYLLTLRLGLGYLGVQTIAVLHTVLYRVIDPTQTSIQKTINTSFIDSFTYASARLPIVLLKPFHTSYVEIFENWEFLFTEKSVRIALSSPITGIACLVLLGIALIRRRISALLIALIGIFPGVAIFTLASYAIESSGVFSRTTVGFSYWVALTFGAIFFILAPQKIAASKLSLIPIIALLTLVFSIPHVSETKKWVESWRFQKALLGSAPVKKLELLPPDTLIVVVFPKPSNTIETFDAFWDISSALAVTYPQLSQHFNSTNFATVARIDEWRSTREKGQLKQKWCTTPASQLNWALASVHVAIWKYPEGTVEIFDRDFEMGCEHLSETSG